MIYLAHQPTISTVLEEPHERKSGIAISFITHENKEHFKLIEKRCKISLNLEQIEDYKLRGETIIKERGLEPIKSKRKSKKDKARELASKEI